ncbi:MULTISPECIES: LysR substrate-binding domain-containing protein [Streptomycetaceae]|uniref:LysR substrate-binding domain-containing protein n=1 Tax=Streptomycetaceae TaxID=2062 RepID=UPI001F51CB53|nr:LysR substrate-binding domain-containing protein [Streptomyces sp. CB02056]
MVGGRDGQGGPRTPNLPDPRERGRVAEQSGVYRGRQLPGALLIGDAPQGDVDRAGRRSGGQLAAGDKPRSHLGERGLHRVVDLVTDGGQGVRSHRPRLTGSLDRDEHRVVGLRGRVRRVERRDVGDHRHQVAGARRGAFRHGGGVTQPPAHQPDNPRVAVGPGAAPGRQSAGVRTRPLLRAHLVGVARKDHPLFGKRITFRRFADAEHIGVSRRGKRLGPIDAALADCGLSRRVTVVIPSHTGAMLLARDSDLITLAPASWQPTEVEAQGGPCRTIARLSRPSPERARTAARHAAPGRSGASGQDAAELPLPSPRTGGRLATAGYRLLPRAGGRSSPAGEGRASTRSPPG